MSATGRAYSRSIITIDERPRHVPEGIPAASRRLGRRGRETMVRLMDAGLVVLAVDGWHDTTVDAVVTRAELSHGTFYLYFGNTTDLLRTLAYECADVMVDLVTELGPVSQDEAGRLAIREWLARFFAAYERYQGVVRAWMENQVDHPELAALGQRVMGTFRTRFVDVVGADEIRAAALLALIERFSYTLVSRDVDLDPAEVLDSLATMVHRGFFTSD